jgi:lysyl-tRNA synthetase class 2
MKPVFEAARGMGIDVDKPWERKIIDEILALNAKEIIFNYFITDYQKKSPLCKQHRDPELTERFELMVCGKEVANAYSELNDPLIKERLKSKRLAEKKMMTSRNYIDEDFLRALEYGMPPTSGLGIGMDRLMMFFNNNVHLRSFVVPSNAS